MRAIAIRVVVDERRETARRVPKVHDGRSAARLYIEHHGVGRGAAVSRRLRLFDRVVPGRDVHEAERAIRGGGRRRDDGVRRVTQDQRDGDDALLIGVHRAVAVRVQPHMAIDGLGKFAEQISRRSRARGQNERRDDIVAERTASAAHGIQAICIRGGLGFRERIGAAEHIREARNCRSESVVTERLTATPAASVPLRTMDTPLMPGSPASRCPLLFVSDHTAPAMLDVVSPKSTEAAPPEGTVTA